MGTRSFLGVKSDRGVLLTTHPLLAPRYNYTSTLLWATTVPATGLLYIFIALHKNEFRTAYSEKEGCLHTAPHILMPALHTGVQKRKDVCTQIHSF
jgi:hypothetical protein